MCMQIGLLKLTLYQKESADTKELQLLDKVQETAEHSGTFAELQAIPVL